MCEFSNQWLAGMEPKLSIETSPNGNILVCSNVKAVNVLPHTRRAAPDHAEEASGQQQCPPKRQKSPSYQRRLCQRAAARVVGFTKWGGIFLYCEIFSPSWPWELSISGDCRLKCLQIFTGNSEHTVVFKI